MQLKKPYIHLLCLRRPSSINVLRLLLALVLLEGANCIDRQRLMRRSVSKHNSSNVDISKIEVSASGIANRSHHKPAEKQVAATVLQDPPAAVVATRVPNRITPPADRSLKIEVSASGIANESLHKPDEEQVASTVLQDPPAAVVASGVSNRITPPSADRSLKIEVSASGNANRSRHKPTEQQIAAIVLHDLPAAEVVPRVHSRITPAALGVAAAAQRQETAATQAQPVPAAGLQAPATAAGEAVPPASPVATATTDGNTDVTESAGAWLSGPIVSLLILGCLMYRCCWSDDAETAGTSTTARRASLDAAAAAFTQRRPSAFAASMHKSADAQATTRPSRKYRRASRDAPVDTSIESLAHSASQPPAVNSPDTPQMKRSSSYRDRRRMSTGVHKGDSETSHAEDPASVARVSTYRARREASRSREPRREASVSREAAAPRGHRHSRESSGSRAKVAEPNNEEF
eukprot:TRINITY_DN4673_c0_g1_i1.p1 TRINITY_DN4673_c0_g1~~TRINITY_DN4673_c0_g1_i1.p1  ORF type:complete len:463 (+),score=77.99 TRINITY_DN4673_c0_g1_i1:149-1537(+)